MAESAPIADPDSTHEHIKTVSHIVKSCHTQLFHLSSFSKLFPFHSQTPFPFLALAVASQHAISRFCFSPWYLNPEVAMVYEPV